MILDLGTLVDLAPYLYGTDLVASQMLFRQSEAGDIVYLLDPYRWVGELRVGP
jgi:hypothetical protein